MAINTQTPQLGFERYPYPGRKNSIFFFPLGILLIVGGAYAGYTSFAEGEWLPGVAVIWFAAMMGLGAIGVSLTGRMGRSRFRYINAVVMTRSESAPVDSWVHVAQTKAVSAFLNAALVLAALGLVVVTIAGALQVFGIIPRFNEETNIAGVLLATVIGAAIATVTCWLSYLNLARAWRSGRFGARPSGVALGEHTVSVRVPGRDGEIAWDHIVAVVPRLLPTKHELGMIELTLSPAAQVMGNVQMLAAQGYTVPTDALWTALRWYHAHPEYRWELGRVEGESRIEGWRLTACKMR